MEGKQETSKESACGVSNPTDVESILENKDKQEISKESACGVSNPTDVNLLLEDQDKQGIDNVSACGVSNPTGVESILQDKDKQEINKESAWGDSNPTGLELSLEDKDKQFTGMNPLVLSDFPKICKRCGYITAEEYTCSQKKSDESSELILIKSEELQVADISPLKTPDFFDLSRCKRCGCFLHERDERILDNSQKQSSKNDLIKNELKETHQLRIKETVALGFEIIEYLKSNKLQDTNELEMRDILKQRDEILKYLKGKDLKDVHKLSITSEIIEKIENLADILCQTIRKSVNKDLFHGKTKKEPKFYLFKRKAFCTESGNAFPKMPKTTQISQKPTVSSSEHDVKQSGSSENRLSPSMSHQKEEKNHDQLSKVGLKSISEPVLFKNNNTTPTENEKSQRQKLRIDNLTRKELKDADELRTKELLEEGIMIIKNLKTNVLTDENELQMKELFKRGKEILNYFEGKELKDKVQLKFRKELAYKIADFEPNFHQRDLIRSRELHEEKKKKATLIFLKSKTMQTEAELKDCLADIERKGPKEIEVPPTTGTSDEGQIPKEMNSYQSRMSPTTDEKVSQIKEDPELDDKFD